ncbi:MAG: ribonuclease HI, partial [Clostridiales bacterium]|nr:ribonuclease HI [Clostridiales bacterium]
KEKCNVNLYSDSAYLVNAIEQHWLDNWRRNAWRTADKKQVKNQDLWQQLSELRQQHNVTFIKVKGHADNEYNNRCDKAARAEISKIE